MYAGRVEDAMINPSADSLPKVGVSHWASPNGGRGLRGFKRTLAPARKCGVNADSFDVYLARALFALLAWTISSG